MATKDGAGDARDQILSGLRIFIDEAQRLLNKTDDRASESVDDMKERMASGLHDARSSMSDTQAQVRASALQAAQTTQRYVESNPWTAIGVGAVAGIVVGMILGRR